MDKKNENIMTGALLVAGGAVVGAGLGLLFAPGSGRENRNGIARLARKAGRSAADTLEDTAREIAGTFEAAGERTIDIVARSWGRRPGLLRRIA